VYEDDAISDGRTDEVNKAIEEYKLALNADPDSAALADDLADLYFRVGRVHDAEVTARMLLKSSPTTLTRTNCWGAFTFASWARANRRTRAPRRGQLAGQFSEPGAGRGDCRVPEDCGPATKER